MALKATIFKAQVQVNDIPRQYYSTHHFTLARHSSETDERMMVRLVAFVLNAHENLEFGRGISTDEDPDLFQKRLSGEFELWVEVGRPSLERIRKACGRSENVRIYGYGDNAFDVWWRQISPDLARFPHLTVFELKNTTALENIARRNMSLQCTADDGMLWIIDDSQTVAVEYSRLTDER